MAPVKSYACSFENCSDVFRKASDLKKHVVAHTHPEKVLKCTVPTCAFDTLQKKNLVIHYDSHTGAKRYKCPDTIYASGSSSDTSADGERCAFRTNDPAALTRHRKSCHGYIPRPRRRIVENAGRTPRTDTMTKGSNTNTRAFVTERRNSFLMPIDSNGESDTSFTTAELTSDMSALTWHGNLQPNPTDAGLSEGGSLASFATPNFNAFEGQADASSFGEFAKFYEETMYKEDYSASYLTEIERIAPDLAFELHEDEIFYRKTGREGCLCPDWMTVAGVEGWDEASLAVN
ncbi:hypothetical protein HYDPIDRAFT_28923 [Hydnomerulius pinastri MD-312]|uniref:Unplaced genomic scaffold scaffold_14, whole genome shotgun sequence n=1 Tax=Hydnomerulius pinastri MD-312 TaxID=994086 RepID=A0A0C9VEN6_9AGAM|nr:hypothetical protein HYDPIDRAFT_28923 [Hydnomerulius pinastri MD-312]